MRYDQTLIHETGGHLYTERARYQGQAFQEAIEKAYHNEGLAELPIV